MPRLTIGVPVYNSETLLEQCLGNLAAQTFPDFKVIILDNASTDGTRDIAQRFAAQDPRFEYHRQPRNVGAKQNFADVLARADTDYFMWRADDDTSDVNFVEILIKLLDANSGAALAASRSELDKSRKRRTKRFPLRGTFEPRSFYRIRLLLRARASWMYGIFRTSELRWSLKRVYDSYAHVNGFDFLVLFPFLWTMRVVGSNEPALVTGFVDRPGAATASGLMDPRPMLEIRRDFLRYCWSILPELSRSQALIALMTPIVWLYADRSYRFVKIVNSRLRVMLGEAPTGVAKNYD